MNINNTCIISCFFGNNNTSIYKPPNGYKSYFFTNNKKLINSIKNNNWNCIYLNFQLYDNLYLSSLQSKYVKFLQFLNDEYKHLFLNYQYIIYYDHKCLLTLNNLNELIKINDKDILIRYTPFHHIYGMKNLYSEYITSLKQIRYRYNAIKVKKYILKLKNNGLLNPRKRVCNTGFIIYNLNNPDVIDLCNNVYKLIKTFKNPECQIFWSIAREPYENIIKCIEYTDILIHHRNYKPIKNIYHIR